MAFEATGGGFQSKYYPCPVHKFGRKGSSEFNAQEDPPLSEICRANFGVGDEVGVKYGGFETEQLSDFSTICPVYPQILGSYPQVGDRKRQSGILPWNRFSPDTLLLGA